jgi:drug/metabolite transporter (DMT)-like permease
MRSKLSPLKSQILGISLALSTAIGCIFYEKIVQNFSYLFFLMIWLCEGLTLFILGSLIFKNDILGDFHKFQSDSKYWIWALLYVATCITSLLWYEITRNQNVMVSSIYEIKYIVMMAILYILFGDNRFTLNTFIGLVFAIISIYFISKS